ncbi:MAG TPA: hypothetical protein VFW05_17160 [Verrucomicrobiae bacterium]|nr:hypothetical protein [Verrucomicrobiae bacterium]
MKPFLAVVAAVAMGFSASALTISPTATFLTGTDTSDLSDLQISSLLGIGNLTTLYRQDLRGDDTGAFAGSYATLFSNTPSEPQDADVTFGSEPSITGFADLWLYVKDGNSDPAFYLINLNAQGWNGIDPLQLRTFWPNDGSITQVRILGNSSAVPDGGVTFALLAAGLSGLGVVRRFVNR